MEGLSPKNAARALRILNTPKQSTREAQVLAKSLLDLWTARERNGPIIFDGAVERACYTNRIIPEGSPFLKLSMEPNH